MLFPALDGRWLVIGVIPPPAASPTPAPGGELEHGLWRPMQGARHRGEASAIKHGKSSSEMSGPGPWKLLVTLRSAVSVEWVQTEGRCGLKSGRR